ncbi:MAG TPA: dCTP deaminase [Ilumatobacteraceae bacterium]
MILSDRSLREQLAAGRIVIDPLDESLIQPSSIDVRIANLFRVFRNHTAGVIDVKQDLTELTELIEIADDGVFMLHPGEFVLGSTLERVAVPEDLVARIEGKSSLGRLGLLIHSSLPASEPILVLDDRGLALRTIGEIVKEQRRCSIVGFDPENLAVSYHDVTGFYEGPEDRIFEVRLASGRKVRVTAGHNLFTLDAAGELIKVRTGGLQPGTRVAVPRVIPQPPQCCDQISVLDLIPEHALAQVTVHGPTVAAAHEHHPVEIGRLLREAGYQAVGYYRQRARLPWPVAAHLAGLVTSLGASDRVSRRGGRHGLPPVITVDEDLAWLLGMYAAAGYRRRDQVVITDSEADRLDRLEMTFARLGLPVYRSPGAVTCRSSLFSDLLGWLGTGGKAPDKRVPPIAFGWSDAVLHAFLRGVVDGDGSDEATRTSVWTTSPGLVADLLLVFTRLGRRAACTWKPTRNLPLWQVYAPLRDDEQLADESLPDEVVGGGLVWDRVVEVVDTGEVETIYDIEVRPGGRKIENFLAGSGGIFVSNTAGFIDAGFDGHITLELANVASLPITLYPGMKIGQLSFMRMTTPAEHPYGSGATGSKYQGQLGPTPSRYFENFR